MPEMKWLKRFRKPECRIEEEWSGSFIGRRRCRTHGDVWDGGGSCPRTNSFLGTDKSPEQMFPDSYNDAPRVRVYRQPEED